MAAPGRGVDPDDVDLPLDLREVTHDNDAESVTVTATTFEEFPDTAVSFKWRIDKNADGLPDVVVFAEWEATEVVAGVDDIEEEPIAEATVTRPAPNSVAVTFPRQALGSVTAYQYVATAENDVNANGEEDPGEEDFAPNQGAYAHDLGPAGKPPAGQRDDKAPQGKAPEGQAPEGQG